MDGAAPSSRAGGGILADRLLTVPNVITVVRLGLLPVYLWLLFGADDRSSAAYLLAALGVTDFLDGYVASRWDQGS
ncbi:MAG: CDP-alcohol phosphatidyltransferase family protein, partial [Acidimicrobiia bacterium]